MNIDIDNSTYWMFQEKLNIQWITEFNWSVYIPQDAPNIFQELSLIEKSSNIHLKFSGGMNLNFLSWICHTKTPIRKVTFVFYNNF
mmetsp:Transcript_16679/g.14592  ORF Transcript_16679/g.14592 Transcript_16679/m.14592 type:complete len:86 (+) Transcript_16679:1212-1469(+)